MSRGSKIRIDEAEIELYLNTKAMLEISALMDKPFSELHSWLVGEDDLAFEIQLARMCDVIGMLANGAIFKHNSEIRMHLKSGDIKEFYDVKFFRDVLDPFQLEYYFNAVLDCIRRDNAVSVPENIKTAEEDEVLKEIEEEKNQMAGDDVTASS